MKSVIGFDFDGVVSLGITPGKDDIIITGRTVDETQYVLDVLKNRGIKNPVMFNPMSLEKRGNHSFEARTYSGEHKARTISQLRAGGINIYRFFEDDEIQAGIIKKFHEDIQIVMVTSDLVEK